MTPDAPHGAGRYARQELIPGWDQERVSKATVVIAGVGALGNEAAKNLALAGVGTIILCDPDTVAMSNLSRTVLLGSGDVGALKAEVAARTLRELVPGIVAEPRVADLAVGVGLGELSDAAVVLSCVDTVRDRMRLLGRCALTGAALVDGGTNSYGGEVRLRLSPEEPCYGCTLSPHERGVGDLPWSCFGMTPDGPRPASIATTALVSSWMSLAAMGIILRQQPPYRMLSIDAVSGRTAPVTIDRDPSCPHHRPLPAEPKVVPATHRTPAGDFLAALKESDEPYTWERFAVGTYYEYGEARRPRYSQRLRDADPRTRLADLGVAPEDILPVRTTEGEYTCLRLSR